MENIPWVGILHQKDKQTIQNNQCITSDIMIQVHNILSKQFLEDIQGFQDPFLAPLFNTTRKRWVSNNMFPEKQGPAVQIHHTGHNHWVTSVLTH